MITEDEDPFATADARISHRGELVTGGRYRLPNLDGTHKPGGWMRTTNLVSAHSDQFALRLWEIEHALRGVGVDGALYASLADEIRRWDDLPKDARKKAVEAFLERCKTATGADRAAKHGNHRHALVEQFHEDDLISEHWSSAGRRDVSLYAAALVRANLRAMSGMQERVVLIQSLDAAGKLDNILEDLLTGILHIGDLKTQKKFWTYLEVKAQFACYANADAMWDAEAGRWVDMPRVSKEVAMALWMPRETEDGVPRVDVLELDIVEGWASAQLAYRIVQDRKAGRKGAWLRPAAPVTATEQWAARFAGVDTAEDGRRLVAEAKTAGVWDAALAESAKLAAARVLTGTRNLVR